jgi:hypothetical protein
MMDGFHPTKVGYSKNTTLVGSVELQNFRSDLKNFSNMNPLGMEFRMKGNVYGNDTKPAS